MGNRAETQFAEKIKDCLLLHGRLPEFFMFRRKTSEFRWHWLFAVQSWMVRSSLGIRIPRRCCKLCFCCDIAKKQKLRKSFKMLNSKSRSSFFPHSRVMECHGHLSFDEMLCGLKVLLLVLIYVFGIGMKTLAGSSQEQKIAKDLVVKDLRIPFGRPKTAELTHSSCVTRSVRNGRTSLRPCQTACSQSSETWHLQTCQRQCNARW